MCQEDPADTNVPDDEGSAQASNSAKDTQTRPDKDLEKCESTEAGSAVSFHDEAPKKEGKDEAKTAGSPLEEAPPDPNVVDWEQPADQDPANPMNWSDKLKWSNIVMLAMLSFTT